MSFEEKNLDVLQNIEFAIQSVYKVQKNLIDYDVTFALESIIDFYSAENIGREPRDFNLSEKSEMVYEFVKRCAIFVWVKVLWKMMKIILLRIQFR